PAGGRRGVRSPQVAPRDHLCRSVLSREVVEGPDRRDAMHWTRQRYPAAAVVEVPSLRRLTRMDVDREERGEQVVGLQQTVDDREQARMLDQQRERRILRQERVDTLGVEALEVVASHVLAVEVGRQGGTHRGDVDGREHVLQHDEALALNGTHMRVGLRVGTPLLRGRHRRIDGIQVWHETAVARRRVVWRRQASQVLRRSVYASVAAAIVITSNSLEGRCHFWKRTAVRPVGTPSAAAGFGTKGIAWVVTLV